jgi:hypothetical protein
MERRSFDDDEGERVLGVRDESADEWDFRKTGRSDMVDGNGIYARVDARGTLPTALRSGDDEAERRPNGNW